MTPRLPTVETVYRCHHGSTVERLATARDRARHRGIPWAKELFAR